MMITKAGRAECAAFNDITSLACVLSAHSTPCNFVASAQLKLARQIASVFPIGSRSATPPPCV
jgi:hypothetical protein